MTSICCYAHGVYRTSKNVLILVVYMCIFYATGKRCHCETYKMYEIVGARCKAFLKLCTKVNTIQ